MMKSEIIEELNRIAKKCKGRITPEQVVEAASDPDSPLHSEFTWDDEKAAYRWRIEQARSLIRGTGFVVKVGETRTMLPGFVRDPEANVRTQGYISISRVKSDEQMARDVLIDEFRRARDVLARAKKIAAYFEMTGEVDEVIDRVQQLSDAVLDRAAA